MFVISHRRQCLADIGDKFIVRIDLDEIFVRKRTFEFYKNFLRRLGSDTWHALHQRHIKILYRLRETIRTEFDETQR